MILGECLWFKIREKPRRFVQIRGYSRGRMLTNSILDEDRGDSVRTNSVGDIEKTSNVTSTPIGGTLNIYIPL